MGKIRNKIATKIKHKQNLGAKKEKERTFEGRHANMSQHAVSKKQKQKMSINPTPEQSEENKLSTNPSSANKQPEKSQAKGKRRVLASSTPPNSIPLEV